MKSFFFSLFIFLARLVLSAKAFAASSSFSSFSCSLSQTNNNNNNNNNVLILDHLNMTHERGRHDWLKAFYFDFLQIVVDPRKAENIEKGHKTLWANIGATQLHLPEGKPDAQVLQGIVTLAYPSIQDVLDLAPNVQSVLSGSKFRVQEITNEESSHPESLDVTDPWGSSFRIVQGAPEDRDARGEQPGGRSAGYGITDLTFYTPTSHTNFEGIGRFYEHILGAPVQQISDDQCVMSVGPRQTLTFRRHPDPKVMVAHEDLRHEVESSDNVPTYLSNYGPHVSMYVADLAATYQRAAACNVTYVNPRFKRRAYTLEEALGDCMFRCLDIVDPANPDEGVILRLEHEVRSVIKPDGTLYKSCPFTLIPPECQK
eukprot:scaffold4223_cov189-Amphora_coffeaeformis.AAC.41